MNTTRQALHPCYTAAGFRTHWTIDHRLTLCGLDVKGGMGDSHLADCRNCMAKTGERKRASPR